MRSASPTDAPATGADRSAVLELAGVRVNVRGGPAIVDGVDLELGAGEVLGLVGESGSGKTTLALSLLGYAADGVSIEAGNLRIAGMQMALDDSMRAMRGSVISYVPQDPSRALNPSLRIAAAIHDILRAHSSTPGGGQVVNRMLETVGLPNSEEFRRRFPHQLSGGQQQRVSISLALACGPSVVVLDEPTTGLDVVTQAKVLDELDRLRRDEHVAMLYVTHDLAVVAQIADRIAVMYAGRVVEQGRADHVLRRPRHPYTRGLLASIPDHVQPRALEPMPGIAVGIGERPAGCSFAPRCPQRTSECTVAVPPMDAVEADHQVRCIHWRRTPSVQHAASGTRGRPRSPSQPMLRVVGMAAGYRSRRATVDAARDISLSIDRGSCLAVVGESGSGKTTIARAIAGLHPPTRGEMYLDGEALPYSIRRRSATQLRRLQLVSQNPAAALNPRHRLRDAIARPAQVLRGLRGRELDLEVARLLESVRLPASIASRYPRELSGGERQRVAIARALAAGPELMICDEVTSALDVSVQAAVLKLLSDLRAELNLSLLFITHDLGVVSIIADEVLVIERGTACEVGDAAAVLRSPSHPYTRRLLKSAPSIVEAVARWEERDRDRPPLPASLGDDFVAGSP